MLTKIHPGGEGGGEGEGGRGKGREGRREEGREGRCNTIPKYT